MLKAYWAEFDGSEWGMLVHGETRGQAKARFLQRNPEDNGEWRWNDVRVRREARLDGKPFTYANADAVGFHYLGFDDEDWNPAPEAEWMNECNCTLCEEGSDGRRV